MFSVRNKTNLGVDNVGVVFCSQSIVMIVISLKKHRDGWLLKKKRRWATLFV